MGWDFSFVHCADLHLGSRCWGLSHEDPEFDRRMYESTFRSFSGIVDVCKGGADFMVVAGDIYDELVETPRTRLFFANEMKRLGKPCFIVTGNHDCTHSWSDGIPYPPNVYQFGKDPQIFKMNLRGRQVEVTGVSFDGPHTDENLVSRLHGSQGTFTIGVVHCSVGDDGNYAPCSMEDFIGKDIQYWALGHIHKRATLRASDPTVIYPGNIQGRDISESGEKGCIMVRVSGDSVETEFIPTQDFIWKEVSADITGKKTVPELLDSIERETGPDMVVGLRFVGRGPLNRIVRSDPGAIADSIEASTGCKCTVRAVSCSPDIDLAKAAESGTMVSDVIHASEELAKMTDGEILDLLCSRGPATDLRIYLDYFAKHGQLKRLVEEAELSAIDRILGAGE